MRKKTIKMGIMPYQQFKNYTMAIAKGQYKPKKTEPKIWFESIKSLAQVLSNENQLLLQLIIDREPDSIKELAELAGRKSNNVSRTLKTLKRYGIVDLIPQKRTVKPVVLITDFTVEFGLSSTGAFFLLDDRARTDIRRPTAAA
jgi:predicted transcriptional regulator